MATARRRSGRIVVDPKVMLGKPVIRGTRITVEIILEKRAAGLSAKQILQEYPRLRTDDIRAAVEYPSRTEMRRSEVRSS